MSQSEETKAGPLHLLEKEETGDRFLIYQTAQGVQLELHYAGDTLWMSQAEMAALFGVDVRTINEHLGNIYSDEELTPEATIRNFRIVRIEGVREVSREINHYNLDAVISVGYRVNSKQGTLFRKWATGVLVQLATKGFVVDAPRLKNPAEYDRVAELREIVRDIRASEANLYAEIRRICSLCQDYDPKSEACRTFYRNMQAKLFWAVCSQMPSMLIAERANAALPNMGLQTWPHEEIRKQDACVAKNYLAPAEVQELNRLTDILLTIFEDQLAIGRLTLMSNAAALMDQQLKGLGRAVLDHGGSISHDQAMRVVDTQYAKFDGIRRQYRLDSYNREITELKKAAETLPKRRG